jgi:hypothetical protein
MRSPPTWRKQPAKRPDPAIACNRRRRHRRRRFACGPAHGATAHATQDGCAPAVIRRADRRDTCRARIAVQRSAAVASACSTQLITCERAALRSRSRPRHRVRLQQQTKLCEIPELLDGDRRHLKGTPPLGEHEALRDEPVQDFAQRRDADAVVLLEAFTPALLPRGG